MSSVSYFSFPFDRISRSGFPGTSLQKQSRKRRRDDTDYDLGHEKQLDLSTFPQASSTITRQALLDGRDNSDHDIGGQNRGAALASEEELPEGNFPHVPLNLGKDPSNILRPRELDTELARLKPPLYVARDSASHISGEQGDGSSVRRRHLGVLTSIMHNCLMHGDYIRAGRAWGMLLRTEVSGHPFDPRIQGRWGIGAEILLRRDLKMADFTSPCSGDESGSSNIQGKGGRNAHTATIFSKEGFVKAKNYYENLILQYPSRRLTPTAINSLYFYPAMFGLWIYSVQEQQKAALAAESECDFDWSSDEERDQDSSVDRSRRDDNREEIVRKSTLRQAELIAARLDTLLLSPPYTDDATLWKLRGMIALWVSDLCVLNPPFSSELDEDDSEKSINEDSMSGDESEKRMEAALKRNLYHQSMIDRRNQEETARRAFEIVTRLNTKVREET